MCSPPQILHKCTQNKGLLCFKTRVHKALPCHYYCPHWRINGTSGPGWRLRFFKSFQYLSNLGSLPWKIYIKPAKNSANPSQPTLQRSNFHFLACLLVQCELQDQLSDGLTCIKLPLPAKLLPPQHWCIVGSPCRGGQASQLILCNLLTL